MKTPGRIVPLPTIFMGDRSVRMEQEIVLGIGGVRALRKMGIQPSVWHINEGHAAFMVLERIRILTEQGIEFPAALEAVSVNTVFTTHTPVPAGHDHFDYGMMSLYFENYFPQLRISRDEFLALGYVSVRRF